MKLPPCCLAPDDTGYTPGQPQPAPLLWPGCTTAERSGLAALPQPGTRLRHLAASPESAPLWHPCIHTPLLLRHTTMAWQQWSALRMLGCRHECQHGSCMGRMGGAACTQGGRPSRSGCAELQPAGACCLCSVVCPQQLRMGQPEKSGGWGQRWGGAGRAQVHRQRRRPPAGPSRLGPFIARPSGVGLGRARCQWIDLDETSSAKPAAGTNARCLKRYDAKQVAHLGPPPAPAPPPQAAGGLPGRGERAAGRSPARRIV